MVFEWDRNKAEANLRKHGVSFHEAQQAFSDVNNVENADGYPFEDRTSPLGFVGEHI